MTPLAIHRPLAWGQVSLTSRQLPNGKADAVFFCLPPKKSWTRWIATSNTGFVAIIASLRTVGAVAAAAAPNADAWTCSWRCI